MYRDFESHTDLAVEADGGDWLKWPGISHEVREEGGIRRTTVIVRDEATGTKIGKPPGTYITLEAPGLRRKDSGLHEQLSSLFSEDLTNLIQSICGTQAANVLIVGLGNDRITPDALGPSVVERVMVTRHFFELMPEAVGSGVRSVCAIAPGVLGTTGIETSEIVQGIVKNVKPDIVIAVDALASRSLERVHTTIQMSDSGIAPGSGVGNRRKALNHQTLGVPVIAVGVPTVVYASTIVSQALDLLKRHVQDFSSNKNSFMGILDGVDEAERLQMIREVLQPVGQDMLVTPKDIDEFLEDMAVILADGMNKSLHLLDDSIT